MSADFKFFLITCCVIEDFSSCFTQIYFSLKGVLILCMHYCPCLWRADPIFLDIKVMEASVLESTQRVIKTGLYLSLCEPYSSILSELLLFGTITTDNKQFVALRGLQVTCSRSEAGWCCQLHSCIDLNIQPKMNQSINIFDHSKFDLTFITCLLLKHKFMVFWQAEVSTCKSPTNWVKGHDLVSCSF